MHRCPEEEEKFDRSVGVVRDRSLALSLLRAAVFPRGDLPRRSCSSGIAFFSSLADLDRSISPKKLLGFGWWRGEEEGE
ncbi:hypothetical protein R1flu_006036 [Riccia fluitans]|uniref:Uncharacterized protein n=1 Tax=Riccia fluitans TaxID=41844 RepID=A0ABD1YXX3_9MARC